MSGERLYMGAKLFLQFDSPLMDDLMRMYVIARAPSKMRKKKHYEVVETINAPFRLIQEKEFLIY